MALVNSVCLSPAKINLMLRIVGQRADGYHELQTIFQLLNWGDHMRFIQLNESGNRAIQIHGFDDLAVEDNLIYHAAMKLMPHAKRSSDWRIEVDKQIPQGAGLGGGSSNAATTLLTLNEHWSCGLDDHQLSALGAELGADVPVFLFRRSALATGIGDQLTDFQVHTPYVLLILPELHINTAKLFKHQDLQRNQQPLTEALWHQKDLWINDFFPLLINTEPVIAELYGRLKQFMQVRLSGTGSALFGLFSDEREAQLVMQHLPDGLNARLLVPRNGSADRVEKNRKF